jgi:hypothetical protein
MNRTISESSKVLKFCENCLRNLPALAKGPQRLPKSQYPLFMLLGLGYEQLFQGGPSRYEHAKRLWSRPDCDANIDRRTQVANRILRREQLGNIPARAPCRGSWLSRTEKVKRKTIRNKVASGILKKGTHYFSPSGLGPRFKWSAIVKWLEEENTPDTEETIPMARCYALGRLERTASSPASRN